MTLKSKRTRYGYIEIRLLTGCWYGLYIDGELKEQSVSLSFIEKEFDRY